VSFLSRAQGRMRGVARGARRPKSRFGSTLEPLSHIRIWFFERENRELVRINQCEHLDSFVDSQRSYEMSVALALMSEVTEAVLPEHEASDPAFRLLLLCSRVMRETKGIQEPLVYFLVWTVRLSGWLPGLARCSKCATDLNGQRGFLALGRAGIVCGNCRRPGMRALGTESLALARRMQESKLQPREQSGEAIGAARELRDFLLDLIEFQIERKLTTRRMLESN
jgi:DNA repair protein RecO (recombination protein O)